MKTRIAVVGIIVEDTKNAKDVNELLHEYGSFIIGRMGIPHRERKISIISVVVDAPQDIISALSGKLGMIPNVSAKAVYSKLDTKGNR